MNEEITRAEFDRLNSLVDKIDEKVDRLSESLIQSITELSGKFSRLEILISGSLESGTQCRSNYDKKFEDSESRIRKIELNWAKVLGIVLASGAVFSVLTFVLNWLG